MGVHVLYPHVILCSFAQKKTSVPATHAHMHADTHALAKAKQMSHQAHISPKFSNSQNRKQQAKFSPLRCAHTHHFHFDSLLLTYGFLSPPASPPLRISNFKRDNKLDLNIMSAVDTNGRWETAKHRGSFRGQIKHQFPPSKPVASQWCEPVYIFLCNACSLPYSKSLNLR